MPDSPHEPGWPDRAVEIPDTPTPLEELITELDRPVPHISVDQDSSKAFSLARSLVVIDEPGQEYSLFAPALDNLETGRTHCILLYYGQPETNLAGWLFSMSSIQPEAFDLWAYRDLTPPHVLARRLADEIDRTRPEVVFVAPDAADLLRKALRMSRLAPSELPQVFTPYAGGYLEKPLALTVGLKQDYAHMAGNRRAAYQDPEGPLLSPMPSVATYKPLTLED